MKEEPRSCFRTEQNAKGDWTIFHDVCNGIGGVATLIVVRPEYLGEHSDDAQAMTDALNARFYPKERVIETPGSPYLAMQNGSRYHAQENIRGQWVVWQYVISDAGERAVYVIVDPAFAPRPITEGEAKTIAAALNARLNDAEAVDRRLQEALDGRIKATT